jgi:putative glutathione S-transferase
VYKAGFAMSQQAYETAVVPIFDSLDRLEKLLTGKDYLVGGILTEADVRLWVTIVGFVIKSFYTITDPPVVARADPF